MRIVNRLVDARRECSVQLQVSVTRWYHDMTPTWLAIRPQLRRRLVLRTHQWIVDFVLTRGCAGPAVLEDLAPDGRLGAALGELVPPELEDRWSTWIRLVLHDLRRALVAPPSPPSEAWCRWLFLIPYAIPMSDPESRTSDTVMDSHARPRSGG
jgi:hypothetical protein